MIARVAILCLAELALSGCRLVTEPQLRRDAAVNDATPADATEPEAADARADAAIVAGPCTTRCEPAAIVGSYESAPERGPEVTVGRDARITRSGHWLRHYRIDELPQLLDVLSGHMSLVGPRPEVPRYVAHYPPDLRERVLSVRPGITDPASLEHIDEARQLATAADPEREYIQVILPRKLQHQARYAEQATLGSDLRVLLRTVRILLSR